MFVTKDQKDECVMFGRAWALRSEEMCWKQTYLDLKKQRKQLNIKIQLAESLMVYEQAIVNDKEDVAELEAAVKTAKNKCEANVRLDDARAELKRTRDLYKSYQKEWQKLNKE